MNKFKTACFAALAAAPLAFAEGETATIPDIGVNVGDYLTGVGAKIGAVLAIGVGIALACWLVKVTVRKFQGQVGSR